MRSDTVNVDEEKDQEEETKKKEIDSTLSESTEVDEQQPPLTSPQSPGRWFYISDSSVREVTEAAALQQQAFILFYARR